MPPKSPKFLSDMLDAANLIETFARDRSVEDLSTDPMLRSAIYYQFAIIGEALSQLRTADPATADRISDTRKIIGFRNQIIHGYAVIKDSVTWEIIWDHLPVLKGELAALLGEV